MMLEGKYLFDILDLQSDMTPYKVIILPDVVKISPDLGAKLDAYVAGGGKILASGDSCVDFEAGKMRYDLGCRYEGKSEYRPGYVNPMVEMKNMDPGAYVVYGEGHVVRVTENGQELAQREASYFNRTLVHFCSHQHAPNSSVIEGSAVTVGSQGAYMSWKVFTE